MFLITNRLAGQHLLLHLNLKNWPLLTQTISSLSCQLFMTIQDTCCCPSTVCISIVYTTELCLGHSLPTPVNLATSWNGSSIVIYTFQCHLCTYSLCYLPCHMTWEALTANLSSLTDWLLLVWWKVLAGERRGKKKGCVFLLPSLLLHQSIADSCCRSPKLLSGGQPFL